MSGYKPREHFEHEFEGDIVSYYLTRLTRQEVMELTPLFIKIEKDESEEAMMIINKIIEFLPMHVQNFDGLVDSNNEPIKLDLVLTDTYFLGLAKEMAGNLMSISWTNKAKDDVLKKSNALLPPQSEE